MRPGAAVPGVEPRFPARAAALLVAAAAAACGGSSSTPHDAAPGPADARAAADAGPADAVPADGPIVVTSVALTPTSLALITGESAQLAADESLSDGTVVHDRPLTWSSSNPAVATVSTTGQVVAIAPGGPVTITATADDNQSGIATVIVTGPIANVYVGPSLLPMIVGSSAQLVADARDAAGAQVVGRPTTWASSDPTTVAVTADGFITAQVANGTATITATAGGHQGQLLITTVDGIITGIHDIAGFVKGCPNQDPAFATIAADFQFLGDGVPLTPTLACTTTFQDVPLAQLTDEMIAYQVLRIAYYMSQGTDGRLPWTQKPLYTWMKGAIAGINFKTAPGQLYCCDVINGLRYFSISRLDDFNRDQKRDWPGLASSFDYFLHEIRHTDGPGHVTGCPAFPSPTGPLGCDATYDLTYLGSYGVQYWLHSGWATGFLHIGIECAPPAVASAYLASHVAAADDFITRFVTNAPPQVTSGERYGGPCP